MINDLEKQVRRETKGLDGLMFKAIRGDNLRQALKVARYRFHKIKKAIIKLQKHKDATSTKKEKS